jgi:hypothetical protein
MHGARWLCSMQDDSTVNCTDGDMRRSTEVVQACTGIGRCMCSRRVLQTWRAALQSHNLALALSAAYTRDTVLSGGSAALSGSGCTRSTGWDDGVQDRVLGVT